jgi:uncharacterized protein with HEPN domain
VSPRFWKDRIRDILDAIAEIQKFTRGMDYETFKEDDKAVRAVEMNFIIIGEAANQIFRRDRREIHSHSMEPNACHAESHCACLF